MFPVASAAETRASCNGFSTGIVGDRPLAGHPPEPVRDKSWTVRREVHLPLWSSSDASPQGLNGPG
jgi:hypothetical protein